MQSKTEVGKTSDLAKLHPTQRNVTHSLSPHKLTPPPKLHAVGRYRHRLHPLRGVTSCELLREHIRSAELTSWEDEAVSYLTARILEPRVKLL